MSISEVSIDRIPNEHSTWLETLCALLYFRNFLVFSTGDDSGQFIAIQRVRDGLPATVVNLSMLETVRNGTHCYFTPMYNY